MLRVSSLLMLLPSHSALLLSSAPLLRCTRCSIVRVGTALPAGLGRVSPLHMMAGEVEIEFAFEELEQTAEEAEKAEAELTSLLDDFEKCNAMTVAELKDALQQLGLRGRGRKSDMIEQLQTGLRKKAANLPLRDTEVHRDTELRWYMLQTANGFERTVETTISQLIEVQGLASQISEIFVPIRQGETSVRESSIMPSYIFLRMKMDSELHQLISSMQYVVNFVGADYGGRSRSGQMQGTRGFVWPLAVSDEQFNRIRGLTKTQDGPDVDEAEEPEDTSAFTEGAVVEVVKGPFKGMRGTISAVGPEPEEVTALLEVMGIETPVTLQSSHCEPVVDAATDDEIAG